MANVKFLSVKLKSTFEALETKDSLALYWIDETQELFKGSVLYGTGALATEKVAGLLSPEDYVALKALIANGSGISNLRPVDGSIVIKKDDSAHTIGVGLSTVDGNMLSVKDDGLYAKAPEYSIEKQASAEDGYSATYKLKKTVDGVSTYVGDSINVLKDLVISKGSLEVVVVDGVPYDSAVIGDPYIDLELNDANTSHIYIPVKGLIDTYIAGNGIEIVDNKISVKIAEKSHGLVAVDGSMSMLLATEDQDGAMSKEDKRILNAIPSVYVSREYEVSHKPEGTIVDYRDKEIRVMCPADTKWAAQNSGEGADANMYYIGFKAYGPKGAVSFKEDLKDTIEDDTMYYFENNEFAGVDAQGRHYSIVWLPVANNVDGAWTYFGATSSNSRYVGWYYSVEWYNHNGVKIGSDLIRINLSNESCHNNINSFYGVENDVATEITSIKETVSEIEKSYTWGEL